MAISFSCAACGQSIRVADEAAGRRGRCAGCGGVISVPRPTPAAARLAGDDAAAAYADDADDAAYADDAGIPFADAPPAYRPSPAAPRTVIARPAAPAARGPGDVVTRPASPAAVRGVRRHLYWALLLVLVPLAWSTTHASPEQQRPFKDRLEATVSHHPEAAERLDDLPDDPTKRQIFAALPDDRLDGALLPEQTWAHWGMAAASGAGFLIAALLLFPGGHAQARHLVVVGLVTGTLGIFLLLAFQWLAFHMPLFRGHGVITLALDLVWLIGQSYRMALGDHGFVLSFLGFTAGVGFCEEACKALPVLFKARSSGFSSWRSAMLWGLVSGIGFGVSEGITYSTDYYNGISGVDAYVVRFVSCVGLHGIWAAAVAITVFRRQDFFRPDMSATDWLGQTLLAVVVPMVLHGLYDTLLKQDYELWALAVAVASFGWLAFQITRVQRAYDAPAVWAALA